MCQLVDNGMVVPYACCLEESPRIMEKLLCLGQKCCYQKKLSVSDSSLKSVKWFDVLLFKNVNDSTFINDEKSHVSSAVISSNLLDTDVRCRTLLSGSAVLCEYS